jgi:hypothetical protein
VATQDVCPGNTAEHLALGSYDAVGYALAVDALDAEGPADPARVPATVCTEPFMPGVDALTFAVDHAGLVAAIAGSSASGPQTTGEPELRPYVFARRQAR